MTTERFSPVQKQLNKHANGLKFPHVCDMLTNSNLHGGTNNLSISCCFLQSDYNHTLFDVTQTTIDLARMVGFTSTHRQAPEWLTHSMQRWANLQ